MVQLSSVRLAIVMKVYVACFKDSCSSYGDQLLFLRLDWFLKPSSLPEVALLDYGSEQHLSGLDNTQELRLLFFLSLLQEFFLLPVLLDLLFFTFFFFFLVVMVVFIVEQTSRRVLLGLFFLLYMNLQVLLLVRS